VRRLYLQIYAVILAILVVFAVLAGAAWHHGGFETQEARTIEANTPVSSSGCLPARPPPIGRRRLRSWLRPWASTWRCGARRAAPGRGRREAALSGGLAQRGWMPAHGGPVGILRLPDGRWLAAGEPRRLPHLGVLAVLSLLAVAVGIGAYPVARR
jgi:hypothetical protein